MNLVPLRSRPRAPDLASPAAWLRRRSHGLVAATSTAQIGDDQTNFVVRKILRQGFLDRRKSFQSEIGSRGFNLSLSVFRDPAFLKLQESALHKIGHHADDRRTPSPSDPGDFIQSLAFLDQLNCPFTWCDFLVRYRGARPATESSQRVKDLPSVQFGLAFANATDLPKPGNRIGPCTANLIECRICHHDESRNILLLGCFPSPLAQIFAQAWVHAR